MQYGYKRTLDVLLSEAIIATKEAMAQEGFGVLTEIDVKATLQKKLGVEYDNYIILGFCNPPFAYKALQFEKEIGLLLPCNVILFEEEGKVIVSAILLSVAINMVDNPNLGELSLMVEEKLKRAIDAI
ncbi:hypothetical protein AUK10_01715 [Candidatus Gracilibacteria bacterium CG2_30_37_12]|nr:MAG: hypothetical protein AUK10_01715 [Candidatus Gracilibacteria bacterium CG2_30_37_12]